MADESVSPSAPVSDHRPVPRGVLPRRFQTWLMAGLAFGILVIILITGQPEPTRTSAPSQPAPVAPNPDRLRDYQERLRALEARQALEAQAAQPVVTEAPRLEKPARPAPEDPLQADRKRREYESLFASNVVLSRRPEAERPDAGRLATGATGELAGGDGLTSSLDEIAQAVVRATGAASPIRQAALQVRTTALRRRSRNEPIPRKPTNGRRNGPVRSALSGRCTRFSKGRSSTRS